MTDLERYSINKLRKFCNDAADNGIIVGSCVPFDESELLDDDLTELIIGIIEGYIEEVENE